MLCGLSHFMFKMSTDGDGLHTHACCHLWKSLQSCQWQSVVTQTKSATVCL